MLPEERDAAYLWDMLEAARTVRGFVHQVTLEDYLSNQMLQLAVEREMEIIGEAARRISDTFKETHLHISWSRIVGLRNVLAHQYGSIIQERIWAIAIENVPVLIATLEPLIPPLPPKSEP